MKLPKEATFFLVIAFYAFRELRLEESISFLLFVRGMVSSFSGQIWMVLRDSVRFSMGSLLRTVDIFLPFRLPMVAEHF